MLRKALTFTLLAAIVATVTLGTAGIAQEQQEVDIRTVTAVRSATPIVETFSITKQPAPLTASQVNDILGRFPSFGDKTLERVANAAPIKNVQQAAALTFETEVGARFVLNQKQLTLIATLWELPVGFSI